jgi:hypothetical protein
VAAAEAAAGPGVSAASASLKSLPTQVIGPGLARPGLPVLLLRNRLYHQRLAPQGRSRRHGRSLMRGGPITI